MDDIKEGIDSIDLNKDKNKIVDKCSKCGGDHFDLSCIYFKVNQSSDNIKN